MQNNKHIQIIIFSCTLTLNLAKGIDNQFGYNIDYTPNNNAKFCLVVEEEPLNKIDECIKTISFSIGVLENHKIIYLTEQNNIIGNSTGVRAKIIICLKGKTVDLNFSKINEKKILLLKNYKYNVVHIAGLLNAMVRTKNIYSTAKRDIYLTLIKDESDINNKKHYYILDDIENPDIHNNSPPINLSKRNYILNIKIYKNGKIVYNSDRIALNTWNKYFDEANVISDYENNWKIYKKDIVKKDFIKSPEVQISQYLLEELIDNSNNLYYPPGRIQHYNRNNKSYPSKYHAYITTSITISGSHQINITISNESIKKYSFSAYVTYEDNDSYQSPIISLDTLWNKWFFGKSIKNSNLITFGNNRCKINKNDINMDSGSIYLGKNTIDLLISKYDSKVVRNLIISNGSLTRLIPGSFRFDIDKENSTLKLFIEQKLPVNNFFHNKERFSFSAYVTYEDIDSYQSPIKSLDTLWNNWFLGKSKKKGSHITFGNNRYKIYKRDINLAADSVYLDKKTIKFLTSIYDNDIVTDLNLKGHFFYRSLPGIFRFDIDKENSTLKLFIEQELPDNNSLARYKLILDNDKFELPSLNDVIIENIYSDLNNNLFNDDYSSVFISSNKKDIIFRLNTKSDLLSKCVLRNSKFFEDVEFFVGNNDSILDEPIELITKKDNYKYIIKNNEKYPEISTIDSLQFIFKFSNLQSQDIEYLNNNQKNELDSVNFPCLFGDIDSIGILDTNFLSKYEKSENEIQISLTPKLKNVRYSFNYSDIDINDISTKLYWIDNKGNQNSIIDRVDEKFNSIQLIDNDSINYNITSEIIKGRYNDVLSPIKKTVNVYENPLNLEFLPKNYNIGINFLVNQDQLSLLDLEEPPDRIITQSGSVTSIENFFDNILFINSTRLPNSAYLDYNQSRYWGFFDQGSLVDTIKFSLFDNDKRIFFKRKTKRYDLPVTISIDTVNDTINLEVSLINHLREKKQSVNVSFTTDNNIELCTFNEVNEYPITDFTDIKVFSIEFEIPNGYYIKKEEDSRKYRDIISVDDTAVINLLELPKVSVVFYESSDTQVSWKKLEYFLTLKASTNSVFYIYGINFNREPLTRYFSKIESGTLATLKFDIKELNREETKYLPLKRSFGRFSEYFKNIDIDNHIAEVHYFLGDKNIEKMLENDDYKKYFVSEVNSLNNEKQHSIYLYTNDNLTLQSNHFGSNININQLGR